MRARVPKSEFNEETWERERPSRILKSRINFFLFLAARPAARDLRRPKLPDTPEGYDCS